MDNKSKALGYLIGKQIAGMRRVTTEPVAWLYNGVRLPKLPEWDREMYPYACVCYLLDIFGSETGYHVLFTSRPLYAKGANSYSLCFHGDVVKVLQYMVVNNVWEFNREYSLTNTDQTFEPLWSNVDMYLMRHDSSNPSIYEPTGTIVLEASEPVPVYD